MRYAHMTPAETVRYRTMNMRALITALTLATVLALLSSTVHGDYLVVLGSYSSKQIAVRELRELESRDGLAVWVDQNAQRQDIFRVVAGPFATYRGASAAHSKWTEHGVADAWITAAQLRPMLPPLGELAGDSTSGDAR